MATIRYRPSIDTASGRRKGWCKHVTAVDPEAKDGYGLTGAFLNHGKEYDLPEGSLILYVEPRGSVKNGWKEARVFRLVNHDNYLSQHEKLSGERTLDWHDDFLTVRDILVDALSNGSADPVCLEFDDKRSKQLRYEYSLVVDVVGESRMSRLAPSWSALYDELVSVERGS